MGELIGGFAVYCFFVSKSFVFVLSSYIEQEVAMDVFRKSGIDPNLLPAIYGMADDDHDGRLTSKEFCVAFHLILCIM